jgi:hypothetical protein
MEFYSIKVGQSFWSKISLTVVTYQSFINNFVKVFFDKENFDSDNAP